MVVSRLNEMDIWGRRSGSEGLAIKTFHPISHPSRLFSPDIHMTPPTPCQQWHPVHVRHFSPSVDAGS